MTRWQRLFAWWWGAPCRESAAEAIARQRRDEPWTFEQ
jgi:hypothetical protein